MAKKRAGLGRGLDVLLSGAGMTDAADADAAELRQLPIESISRGKYQPRVSIRPEALQELADSIKSQGLVQPILVRPVSGGYELIAGERRWRAAQLAGLHEIPAVVREIPDQAAAAMSLIENIQREQLNPLEEANALARLVDEFGMTHQQVADAVGRSRAAVTNLLRLQELESAVKKLIEAGSLDMGHARALLGLSGDQQRQAARQVADKGMSVRDTERLVKNWLRQGEKPAADKSPRRSPELEALESEISERLGARIDIQYDKKGRGKLVIHYNSLDELDGIIEHLR